MKIVVLLLIATTASAVYSARVQCKHKLDIVTVLDGSDSIARVDFITLKNSISQLINDLDIGENGQSFGAVVFSRGVSSTIPLSTNRQTLLSAVSKILHPREGTDTDLGIKAMKTMFESKGRNQAKKIGIVITDGESTNINKTLKEAKDARKSGITLLAVGVGGEKYLNFKELHGIASSSSNVLHLKSFDALKIKLDDLVKKICIIPVDGGWSSWSSVSSHCSKTCGPGIRTITMTRKCNNPIPEDGGKDCPGISTKSHTQACKEKECPIDCKCSAWSSPSSSQCSVTCGSGVVSVTQTRTCTEPKHGGKPCSGDTVRTYTETCRKKKCPIDGGWSDWSPPSRSQCSVTCGSGVITVTQTRTCSNPAPKYGGKSCVGRSVNTYKETCKKKKCLLCSGCTCDGCHYENGVGYMPHPTDCRFFLQCVNWGASYHIKRCSRDTHWNQNVLSCIRKDESNCSHSATVVPLDETVTPAPPPPPSASGCDGTKKPVPGKMSKYYLDVPGHGWKEMSCATGTVYNSSSCNCEHGGTVIHSAGCDPELYLPLRRNVTNVSKHQHYIAKNHIEITTSEYASFAKSDARIRINRFSNADFGKTLKVTFQMYRGQYTGQSQAILSNAQCDKKGSIYVIQKASAIKFQVENDRGVYSTLVVPMTKPHADVSLTINGGLMTAVVNKYRKETPFQGRIGTVHCALQLGQATGYANFRGMLREFKLYMCAK